jgi:hypothetical protein
LASHVIATIVNTSEFLRLALLRKLLIRELVLEKRQYCQP